MGRRGYPPEFRRKVLDLVEAGRPIADVARDLGISGQSIYTWRRQDRIDRGLPPGLSSGGRDGQAMRWPEANAGRFGWHHQQWAQRTRSKPEHWHWEYRGGKAPPIAC